MEVVPLSNSTTNSTSNSPTVAAAGHQPSPHSNAGPSTQTTTIASPTRKRPREFGQTPPLSPAAIPKKSATPQPPAPATTMSPTATAPVAMAGGADAAATVAGASVPAVVHNGKLAAAIAVDQTDQATAAAQQPQLQHLNGGDVFTDVALPSTSAAAGSSCSGTQQADITVRSMIVLITIG